MPSERQDHGDNDEKHCKGSKERADLGLLFGHDQICGQVLEDVVQFIGTTGGVIRAARHFGDGS